MSNKFLPTVANLSDPREAAFVATIFELGGPQHAPEAAYRAGYGKTPAEAERAAAFLLGAPRIAKVIVGEIKSRMDVAAASAFNTLLEICADPRAKASARITAATEILNRSTLGPPISRSATLRADVSIEDLLDQLDKRAEAQGVAASEVLDPDPLPGVALREKATQ